MTRGRRPWLLVVLLLAPFGSMLAADQDDPQRALDALVKSSRDTLSDDYDAALQMFRQALEDAGSVAGEDADHIRTLESLAALAKRFGEPAEAVRLYEASLALRNAGAVEKIDTTTAVFDQLSTTAKKLGDTERAEQALREAIEIRTSVSEGDYRESIPSVQIRLAKLIGASRPGDAEAEELLLASLEAEDSARVRHELALLYRARADHERELVMALAGLELAEQSNASGYWTIATLNDIAEAYNALDSPELAEDYLLQAIEVREELHGDRHPYVASSLVELARLYVTEERYVEAETLLRRALSIKQAAYGDCSSCNRDVTSELSGVYGALGRDVDFCTADTPQARPEPEEGSVEQQLTALDAQAATQLERGQYHDARLTAERSLELREQTYGVDSPRTLASLRQLTRVATGQGRQGEQLELWQRILGTLEIHAPADDPALAMALEQVGRRLKPADPSAAIEYFEREAMIREALGQNMSLARRYNELGTIARELEDDRAAAEHFARAADFAELASGPRDRHYVTNRIEMSRSYSELGMIDEAEEVLQQLMQPEDPRDAPDERQSVEILEALKRLYGQTERQDAARSADDRIRELKSR